MLISVICGILTGRISNVSDAILSGSDDAIKLIISLTGMMCFWTGMMKIADKGNITAVLAKFLSPINKHLFPHYEKTGAASKAICMSMIANFLGLGNAATPLGIIAMKEMQKETGKTKTLNNSMIMFVVLNTASIQLIPTTMIVLRKIHGSKSPFEIIIPVWISSVIALAIGITVAKLLEERSKIKKWKS
jgi:spore maturation protein A